MLLLLLLGLTAFCVSLILTRTCRSVTCTELLDVPNSLRKVHSSPIPRSGGTALCLSYMAALAVWSWRTWQPEQAEFLRLVSTFLPGAMIVFGIGLLDDFFALTAWQKLAGQTLAAIVVHSLGFSVSGDPGLWWSPLATVFWLLLTTNGFNLIDGLDGLAAGIGLVAVCAVIIAAIVQGNMPLALIAVPLLGSILGFLPYNSSPASVFLGDSGSLFLGFMCGCATVIWSRNSTSLIGSLAPIAVLAIPIVEVCLSTTRRLIEGNPVFQADRDHIHHRLLNLGFSALKSVILLEAFAAAGGLLALMAFRLSPRMWLLLVVAYSLITAFGIIHLGYLQPNASVPWLRRASRFVRD